MHFSASFIALVATTLMPLLTSAIQLTNQFSSVTSGQQLTLTWTGDGTPVSIELANGNPGSGSFVSNLGQSVSGTSSQVTIPNVPSGTYTIEIQQSGQTSYSSQFTITGNGQGPAVNNNNNNNNNGGINNGINNGQCEECEQGNNGYNNGAIETYITTYVSLGGTYTTTTTGPCTTGTFGYGYGTTSCIPGVTQVINGVTYGSSCTTYGQYATTQVINGVTQINDGQVQANGATTTPIYNPGTATTLPLTGTYTTATGTTTGVQSFFGAAPKVPLSAGAAVLAGGLVALIIL